MATFELLERSNYPGSFELRLVGGKQNPAEVRLFDGLRRLLSELDDVKDAKDAASCVDRLRQIAIGGLIAPDHKADVWLPELFMFDLEFHGRPAAPSHIREGKYFGVALLERPGAPDNIQIWRVIGSDTPPSSYHDLLARYDDSRAGLLTILDSITSKLDDPAKKRWFFPGRQRRRLQINNRLFRYIHQLVYALFGGLEQDDVETATKHLSFIEREIVSREANWVKNGYMARLGLIAFPFALLLLALYGIVRGFELGKDEAWVVWRFREFLLLAGGCSIGTWLSFAIRHPRLDTVRDLAVMELDQLNPINRVLFSVSLSIVVGLILQSGMLEISINGFRSTFQFNGVRAILLGLVCGISEIIIRDVVRARSDDIVGRLAVQSSQGT